jgi:dTDP-4-dehydrorhamnose 3,5-epimerase
MRFLPTPLEGATVILPEPLRDERGYFARTFSVEEFAAHGLDPRVNQCNLAFNERRGTLRGLHYQAAPHGEAKLVTCVQGALWDVIVDLRPGSPTHGRWHALELTAQQRSMLFVPEGFAHGYQTLEDATAVFYQMSSPHHPEAARGIRWNDPALALPWPIPVPIISERDATFGTLAAAVG